MTERERERRHDPPPSPTGAPAATDELTARRNDVERLTGAATGVVQNLRSGNARRFLRQIVQRGGQ